MFFGQFCHAYCLTLINNCLVIEGTVKKIYSLANNGIKATVLMHGEDCNKQAKHNPASDTSIFLIKTVSCTTINRGGGHA